MAARITAPLLAVALVAPWLTLSGAPRPTCPTEPIPLARLNAVAAAAPPPSSDDVAVPVGVRAATPDETGALRDALEAFVACGDAGEPLRVLALYTDRYLGELLYRQGELTEEQYLDLARADPADPDERTRLLAVSSVRALGDGRVVGEATIRYAVIPTPKRFVVTIARADGAWRIDDVLGELTFALP